MNNLRTIRNIIYTLKRQYSQSITIYRRVKTVTDTKKGIKKHFYTPYYVRRAAVLPAKLTREEHRNVKGLWRTYYDQSITSLIVDGRDIPITIKEDDLIEVDGAQGIVSQVDNAGDGQSFLIEVKAVETYTRITNFVLATKNSCHYFAEVSND